MLHIKEEIRKYTSCLLIYNFFKCYLRSPYIVINFFTLGTLISKQGVYYAALLISKQYIVAMSGALLEYMIEIILFQELKEYTWISNFALVTVIVGELMHKGAVLTARHAFTRTIRTYREDNHELITHGIYP